MYGRSLGSIHYHEEEIHSSNGINKKLKRNSLNAPFVPTYHEVGDEVSMEIVNLPDEQLSNKLQFELAGPFKVIKKGKLQRER